MNSPLDDDSDFNVEEWVAKKHVSYEEKILKQIMTRFGIQGRIADLKRACKEVTGAASLNWDWFINEYPTFPVRLLIRSIPYVYKIELVDLFNRFTKTSLFIEFDKAIDLYGINLDEEPVALIFNWPKIGSMALHSYRTNNSHDDTRLVRNLFGDTFVLEKLATLLNTISQYWEYH